LRLGSRFHDYRKLGRQTAEDGADLTNALTYSQFKF
jgi:hypothetical protein